MGFNKHLNQRTLTLFGSLALLLGSSMFMGQACSDVGLKPLTNPTTITVHIQNYCPVTKYTFRDAFLYNASARLINGGFLVDSDRDGIPDSSEKEVANLYGISTKFADTNGDYFSDLIIFKMNLNQASQAMLPLCNTGNQDVDGDGLNDCEEAYLQLDKQKADTDFDGIPDGIEFRFGTRANDPNDAVLSLMGDDMTNLDKMKANIPVALYADDDIKKMGVQYDINPIIPAAPAAAAAPPCYDLKISNVPIVPVTNGNKVMVYVTEDTINNTSGTSILVREVRWLMALVPQEIEDKSTVLISDGIHQQVIDGTIIPLVVLPPPKTGGSK